MNEQDTCPCQLCGKQTFMLGTRLCDICWELQKRINFDLDLTIKILKLLGYSVKKNK